MTDVQQGTAEPALVDAVVAVNLETFELVRTRAGETCWRMFDSIGTLSEDPQAAAPPPFILCQMLIVGVELLS